MNSEYVVKSKSMMKYLFVLGFNYRTVIDRTGKRKYVYLFEINDLLMDAIKFYTEFKNKQKF